MMERNVWFAVMLDNEDKDHGMGSFDIYTALDIALKYRAKGYPDAYILAVDPEDDFALFDIRGLDKFQQVEE